MGPEPVGYAQVQLPAMRMELEVKMANVPERIDALTVSVPDWTWRRLRSVSEPGLPARIPPA